MSVRQYIGARYVTKIYENSLDPSSAEWEASVNYEPLTMVTYNYGSYLSKKEVPASIGNPADNPTYWVQTGFYNGQIADLQNQINGLDTRIINLENTNSINLVCIGDSYGDGVGGAGSWCDYTAEFLGLTNGVDYFKSSMTTVGFVNTYLGNTFQTLMETLAGTMTSEQKNKITHLVVAGGYNDKGYTPGTIGLAIRDFVASAKNNFPNAKIYIGCIGWTTEADVKQQIIKNSLEGYSLANHFGASYIQNSQYLLHNYSLIQADNTHPTDSGARYIGYGIGQFVECGSLSCAIQHEAASITPASLWDGGIDNGIFIRQDNAVTGIDIYNVELKLSTPGRLDSNYDYPLGTLNSNLIHGGRATEEYLCIENGIAEFVTTGGTYTTQYSIYCNGTYGTNLTIRFGSFGTQTTTLNISKVILRGHSGTLPTLWC